MSASTMSTTQVTFLPQENPQLIITDNKRPFEPASQDGRSWKKSSEFCQGLLKLTLSVCAVAFFVLMAVGALAAGVLATCLTTSGCLTGNIGLVGLGVGSIVIAGLCASFLNAASFRKVGKEFGKAIEHFKVAFENPQQDEARQRAKRQELLDLRTDLNARIEANIVDENKITYFPFSELKLNDEQMDLLKQERDYMYRYFQPLY